MTTRNGFFLRAVWWYRLGEAWRLFSSVIILLQSSNSSCPALSASPCAGRLVSRAHALAAAGAIARDNGVLIACAVLKRTWLSHVAFAPSSARIRTVTARLVARAGSYFSRLGHGHDERLLPGDRPNRERGIEREARHGMCTDDLLTRVCFGAAFLRRPHGR